MEIVALELCPSWHRFQVEAVGTSWDKEGNVKFHTPSKPAVPCPVHSSAARKAVEVATPLIGERAYNEGYCAADNGGHEINPYSGECVEDASYTEA